MWGTSTTIYRACAGMSSEWKFTASPSHHEPSLRDPYLVFCTFYACWLSLDLNSKNVYTCDHVRSCRTRFDLLHVHVVWYVSTEVVGLRRLVNQHSVHDPTIQAHAHTTVQTHVHVSTHAYLITCKRSVHIVTCMYIYTVYKTYVYYKCNRINQFVHYRALTNKRIVAIIIYIVQLTKSRQLLTFCTRAITRMEH